MAEEKQLKYLCRICKSFQPEDQFYSSVVNDKVYINKKCKSCCRSYSQKRYQERESYVCPVCDKVTNEPRRNGKCKTCYMKEYYLRRKENNYKKKVRTDSCVDCNTSFQDIRYAGRNRCWKCYGIFKRVNGTFQCKKCGCQLGGVSLRGLCKACAQGNAPILSERRIDKEEIRRLLVKWKLDYWTHVDNFRAYHVYDNIFGYTVKFDSLDIDIQIAKIMKELEKLWRTI